MDTATAEIYTLSLHDALPIFRTATFWPGEGACATPQRLLVGRTRDKPGRATEHCSPHPGRAGCGTLWRASRSRARFRRGAAGTPRAVAARQPIRPRPPGGRV